MCYLTPWTTHRRRFQGYEHSYCDDFNIRSQLWALINSPLSAVPHAVPGGMFHPNLEYATEGASSVMLPDTLGISLNVHRTKWSRHNGCVLRWTTLQLGWTYTGTNACPRPLVQVNICQLRGKINSVLPQGRAFLGINPTIFRIANPGDQPLFFKSLGLNWIASLGVCFVTNAATFLKHDA